MWWGEKVDDDGIVFCVQGTLLSVFLQPETKARKWKRERERDWGEGSDGKKTENRLRCTVLSPIKEFDRIWRVFQQARL